MVEITMSGDLKRPAQEHSHRYAYCGGAELSGLISPRHPGGFFLPARELVENYNILIDKGILGASSSGGLLKINILFPLYRHW